MRIYNNNSNINNSNNSNNHENANNVAINSENSNNNNSSSSNNSNMLSGCNNNNNSNNEQSSNLDFLYEKAQGDSHEAENVNNNYNNVYNNNISSNSNNNSINKNNNNISNINNNINNNNNENNITNNDVIDKLFDAATNSNYRNYDTNNNKNNNNNNNNINTNNYNNNDNNKISATIPHSRFNISDRAKPTVNTNNINTNTNNNNNSNINNNINTNYNNGYNNSCNNNNNYNNNTDSHSLTINPHANGPTNLRSWSTSPSMGNTRAGPFANSGLFDTTANNNSVATKYRNGTYSPQIIPRPNPLMVAKKHPGARSRPIPEYLNFRKFSVPLISPRPKVEVAKQAVDDQSRKQDMEPEQRTIQKSASQVDSSSQRHLLREGDELSICREKSLRYTGRTNPSKVFQLLQLATGSNDDETLVTRPPPVRRTRKVSEDDNVDDVPPDNDTEKKRSADNDTEKKRGADNDDKDDVVEISYVGGNIPSRTFQCLKDAVEEKEGISGPFDTQSSSSSSSPPPSSVKVVHLRPRKSIDDVIAGY